MTGDLISRTDALSALKGVIARTGGFGVAIEVILANLPAVEAEPVVHAHWEPTHRYGFSRCSACGIPDQMLGRRKRCSSCGAHMDEEVADV